MVHVILMRNSIFLPISVLQNMIHSFMAFSFYTTNFPLHTLMHLKCPFNDVNVNEGAGRNFVGVGIKCLVLCSLNKYARGQNPCFILSNGCHWLNRIRVRNKRKEYVEREKECDPNQYLNPSWSSIFSDFNMAKTETNSS